MHLLFVCTANTCRSPIAAALCQTKIKDKEVKVRSAGTHAVQGESASVYAQSVLIDRGIYYDHSTQKLNKDLIKWADIILTMEQKNQEEIITQFPKSQPKVYRLKEFIGSSDNLDISDPFGGNLGIYKQCRDEIEHAVDLLLKKLGLLGTNATEKGSLSNS